MHYREFGGEYSGKVKITKIKKFEKKYFLFKLENFEENIPEKSKFLKIKKFEKKKIFRKERIKTYVTKKNFFWRWSSPIFRNFMVEMAGTAPACTEVLSPCIPVYDSFFSTVSLTMKNDKKEKSLSRVLTSLQDKEPYGVRLISTTILYKFRE